MLTHTRQNDCVSDLTFDRWLADGDSPQAEHADVQAHLACCARCALRLEAITASRETFLRRQPSWNALHAARAHMATDTASTTTGDVGARSRARALWVGGVAGSLAAAALALIALRSPHDGAAVEGVRTKGGASIGAYLNRDGAVDRLVDGDAVHPGDRLRFVYSSEAPSHFGLLQYDGTSASIYHPLGQNAAAVEPGRDVPLDFSIRLDAAGHYERLFGVFCHEPVALEPLRAQLQNTGRFTPPPGCHVDELALDKRGAAR